MPDTARRTLPRLIGPYRIADLVGEGGTALVYLAEQVRPHRLVALKALKSHLLSESSVIRFERELQVLAALNHPNIAQVYDFAARGRECPYFTMEYIDGPSLTSFCDGERLPVRDRIRLFLAVCDAIHYVHLHGIVHRDLKPSNVLVTSGDSGAIPKVIDFGIAKLSDELWETTTALTEQGVVMGTLAYMSPEQAGLSESPIDARTDVYSLGVMLHELVVGRLPIELPQERSGYPDFLRRIREVDPARPAAVLDQMPPDEIERVAAARRTTPAALAREARTDLQWILLKAIEKHPERRYGTALELRKDLQSYLDNEPVTAAPPSASDSLRRAIRRHRRVLTGGLAVAVATAISAILGSVAYLRLDAEHQRRLDVLRTFERVQLAVANAHLWFEEALAGDTTVDLRRDVADRIDAATRLLSRPADPALASVLRQLREQVGRFKRITQQRWAAHPAEGRTGGALDESYDETYRTILRTSRTAARRFGEPPSASRTLLARAVLTTNLGALGLMALLGAFLVRAWLQGRP